MLSHELENLKHNLEAEMLSRGYTMKSLSLAAGLSETAVRDLLKGRITSPSYHTLSEISKVLRCSIDQLLKSDGIPQTKFLDNLLVIEIKKFEEIVKAVDQIIKEYKLELSSDKKARVYLAWYEISTRENKNPFSNPEILSIIKFQM